MPMRFRARRADDDEEASGPTPNEVIEVDVGGLAGAFTPPRWLRDLGLMSWLLVGVVVVTVGLVWLVAETQEISIPVILGTVIAAVASPLVAWMQRHGIGRALGAILTLLGVVAFGVLILLLVLGGIARESDQVGSLMSEAAEEVASWFDDLGVSKSEVEKELKTAIPDAGKALIEGVGGAIGNLASVGAILVFTVFTTFFLLKDGPSMRRWVEGHMGLPAGVGRIVVGRTLTALRGYFLGVTIVAAFNAILIGGGAWLLDVPLAGTIAVVTFVGAYVPYIGAWIAGFFAVGMALTTGDSTAVIGIAVIALLANGILQQIVQPIAYGATLGLNPLVVLIVTIGGGALFGMVGLVLSAPLTSAASNIAGELARRRAEGAPAEGEPAPTAGGPPGTAAPG